MPSRSFISAKILILLLVDEFRDNLLLLLGPLTLVLPRRPLTGIPEMAGTSMKPCEDDGMSGGIMSKKDY